MRAIRETNHGGPDVLALSETPVPSPAPHQVLLKVIASGINRADVMQRRGFYPPPPGESDIYGLEVSGTVLETGSGVPGDLLGQNRMALLASGGYAEYALVDYRHTLPIPAGLSPVEAAGVMEVAATVYSNLLLTCGLGETPVENAGRTLLVHGGTGGIGSHAIQLATALGIRVFATAGSASKCARVKELGATPINYRSQNFREVIRGTTDGRGVDAILDVVGGAYLEENIKTLALDGALVVIGLQGGAKGQLNLGYMLPRRLSVHATSLRSRSAEEKARIVAGVGRVTLPLIASGAVTPNIDRVFPLAEAGAAHTYFDSGQHLGKVLLVP